MDKRNLRRAAVELVKDLLILLLTASALWMLSRGSLFQRLELGREPDRQTTGVQDSADDLTRAASPLSITAMLGEGERCALRYDAEGVDTLFHRSAGLLMEALSSAGAPQRAGRQEWERAMKAAPGLCLDFQGEMPLSVLTGWLGGELSIPDTRVRRLLLTGEQEGAALYYYDLEEKVWYRCATQVITATQLTNALEGLTGDDSWYAFESAQKVALDPDTLFDPGLETLPVCLVQNPAAAGRAALESLMEDLGINPSGSVFYSAAGEEVVRSGSDTLRLSQDGVAEYSGSSFRVDPIAGQSEVYAAVESCRRLLERGAVPRSGAAGFYLSRVEETAAGFRVEFEYTLNGAPVSLHAGPAAQFEITDGGITAFTLRLRGYTQSEESQLLLPPVQAAAAMGALALEGRELTVTYHDYGEERVVPQWTALSR